MKGSGPQWQGRGENKDIDLILDRLRLVTAAIKQGRKLTAVQRKLRKFSKDSLRMRLPEQIDSQ